MLRESTRRGDYVQAFWRCAVAARSINDIAGLRLAPELTATISGLYQVGSTVTESWILCMVAE
jgi:hypothetical protein